MPRNKYPEETEKKIIQEAMNQFMTKGYDNTSVQDIIDATGLSKGAIYHHFDSKESILLRVYAQIEERTARDMMRIVHDEKMNGLEKLQAMFFNSCSNQEHIDFIASVPNLLENPRFLALQLKSTIEDVVPNYIYPVLQEGIEDGSICCKYPLEAAHVLMLLTNIWMNPLIYTNEEEKIEHKMEIFRLLLQALGIEGIHQGLGNHIHNVMDATDLYSSK